jgi:nucleoside-diphosphate-sugar epimerase
VTEERGYLVTGASGFVGRALCAKLKGSGRVRALFRRPADGPWDEAITLDLSEGDTLPRALAGVDTVFHLAGKTDDSRTAPGEAGVFQRVNVDGTRRLVDASAASGVSKFVYLSSIKAMGTGSDGCIDESAPARETTPYGRSKRAAEELVLGSRSIRHVCVLRSSPVYGAGSKGNLSRMIAAMARGYFPPVPRTRNARSMVHVEDLADALMLAAEKDAANRRVFIVTDGRAYSTRQIYEWACASMGRRPPRWSVPAVVFKGAGKLGDALGAMTGKTPAFNTGMVERLLGSAWYDSGLITQTLGFKPKRNLEEALKEIAAPVLDQR